MSSCCSENKNKYNCGERVSSSCVFYNEYFPKYSELKDSDCVTIQETTEELYKNQENIWKHLDTKDLGKECFDYPTVEIDDKEVILVKDILKKHEEEICRLKDKSSGSSSGTNNNPNTENNNQIDLKCLTNDPCYEFYSKDQVIQLLINKVCELEGRLKKLEDGE